MCSVHELSDLNSPNSVNWLSKPTIIWLPYLSNDILSSGLLVSVAYIAYSNYLIKIDGTKIVWDIPLRNRESCGRVDEEKGKAQVQVGTSLSNMSTVQRA